MKKKLAEWGKGSTFAPAFGRNERETRGDPRAEFFESLRPAQEDVRAVVKAGVGHGKRKQRNEGGTRDTEEKFEKDNSTTKSLILAQDER